MTPIEAEKITELTFKQGPHHAFDVRSGSLPGELEGVFKTADEAADYVRSLSSIGVVGYVTPSGAENVRCDESHYGERCRLPWWHACDHRSVSASWPKSELERRWK